jgi:hypothetical protein
MARTSHSPAEKKGVAMELTARDANDIAVEGYVYLYSLVTMDVTRKVLTNLEAGRKPGFGPAGLFHHFRAFPGVDFREVVRPNFDTLYSTAWFDVGQEPVVVSVPDTGGRYYVLPIYDMWSEVFASIGKRTTGTRAGDYAVVGKGWSGTLPAGIQRIDAPTPTCWIIVRTQTNGHRDYQAVHDLQAGFRLTPLSRWGRSAMPVQPRFDPAVDLRTPPTVQVNRMSGAQFYACAAEVMKTQPPHLTDWSILARLRRLGFEPGQGFAAAQAPAMVQAAIDAAPSNGLQQMQVGITTLSRVSNGWQMNVDTMGVYGNNYLKRAVVALIGLGASQCEDAVHPMTATADDGKALDGSSNYVLHFRKEELPPANAFWSLTMYDAQGFQAPNPINRYSVGDRDALQYNADGSLDILIQHESPGPAREPNWLPAPPGKLGITMRLYAPRPEVLHGRWNPPPVRRVR